MALYFVIRIESSEANINKTVINLCRRYATNFSL